MSGYVYILTNPSFKDNWVKIGKSSRPVDIRSKELDNTAVPLPFEIYAVMETEKYNEAERQIHNLIDLVNPSMRIRKGREFFNVTPETALRIFRQCALTIDDAEITEYGDEGSLLDGETSSLGQHGSCRLKPSSRLTFSMLNIPVGAELTFAEDSSIKARVVNLANIIELESGTKASLSKAAMIVKRQLGTDTASEAYRGGHYWLYNGERLTSIRERVKNDLNF